MTATAFPCVLSATVTSKWSKQEKREMMDAWIILTIRTLAVEGLVKA